MIALARSGLLAACLFAILPGTSVFAREVPALTGPVIDEAGVFSPEGLQSLSSALTAFYQKTGVQMQVLTIESLQGDNLEDFSIRVADRWKIGRAETDKGLILLFSLNDRRVRIEVGQGLEGDIPDVIAGRIIRDVMTPEFKAGRFENGMTAGLQAIAQQLGHSLDGIAAAPKFKNEHLDGFQLFFLIAILIFFKIASLFGRPGRYGFRGRYSGGGGGWSGGSGSGWSGGGGGFSGGGASGSW